MRVANRSNFKPTRPPMDWREERRERIESQQAEREERKHAPPASTGKDSAVVSRARLRKQRGAVERFTAWGVLFISFLGSIVALHGGWPAFLGSLAARQPNIAALLGGVLIQLVLTFLEWYYFDRPAIAWGARIADAATTALGYGPLVLAPMVFFLTSRGFETANTIAWAIIGLVSLGVAWYPENRLVD